MANTHEISQQSIALVEKQLTEAGVTLSQPNEDRRIHLAGKASNGSDARIQVKGNAKPKPGGGKGKLALDWWVEDYSPADLIALADLSTARVWLMTLDEIRELAEQHSSRRHHLYMYVDPSAKLRVGKHDSEFASYLLDRRVSQFFKLTPSSNYSPSPQQFVAALDQLKLTNLQEELLATHAESPQLTLTATELARRVGYNSKATANSQYGRLGRLIGAAMNSKADFKHSVAYLVEFGRNEKDEITWTLRASLAEAVSRLGFSTDHSNENFFPDEIPAGVKHIEGAVRRVSVNAYERNPKARAACLAEYSYRCSVCDLLMEEMYGEIGAGFIHVHHLKPLAEIRKSYQIKPLEDLRPVCPNCHAMLHTQNPPLKIEELRSRLRKRG